MNALDSSFSSYLRSRASGTCHHTRGGWRGGGVSGVKLHVTPIPQHHHHHHPHPDVTVAPPSHHLSGTLTQR